MTQHTEVKPMRWGDEDLVQLADVFCGAIGWAWNGRKSTCGAKALLADHIVAAVKWPHLEHETLRSAAKMNVWRYRPKR